MSEASEARQIKRSQRDAKEQARRSTEPQAAVESPYRAAAVKAATPTKFREVFKELERQFSESKELESIQASIAPPPLPSEEIEVDAPAFEPEIPPSTKPHLNRTAAAKIGKRFNAKNKPTASLGRILQNRSQLRTALILKEVLEKPKALRR